ncbi:MAG: OmpA family protein [Pseudomonadota bacterium]
MSFTKVFLLAVGFALGSPALAQQQSSAAIIDALMVEKAGPTVRSMNSIAKRGIDVSGPLPPMIDLPSISLTVNFELGSDKLTTDGMIALRSLAKALLDTRLKGMVFQVAGHTDGRGDAAYNQGLSERRAMRVVNHLVTHYEVPRTQMIPVGHGFSRPMDPGDLLNPLNRRVEIINLEPLS